DRPASDHRGFTRLPHLQPTLDLVRLDDALLRDAQWLGNDRDVAQTIGHLDDIHGVVDIVLGEISVPAADATLEVDLVGGHVVCADLVVNTGASAADRGNHIVARRQLAYLRPDGLHTPEVFM